MRGATIEIANRQRRIENASCHTRTWVTLAGVASLGQHHRPATPSPDLLSAPMQSRMSRFSHPFGESAPEPCKETMEG